MCSANFNYRNAGISYFVILIKFAFIFCNLALVSDNDDLKITSNILNTTRRITIK